MDESSINTTQTNNTYDKHIAVNSRKKEHKHKEEENERGKENNRRSS